MCKQAKGKFKDLKTTTEKNLKSWIQSKAEEIVLWEEITEIQTPVWCKIAADEEVSILKEKEIPLAKRNWKSIAELLNDWIYLSSVHIIIAARQ